MFKLLKFIKGKARTFAILGIVCILLQTIFSVLQPLVLMFIVELVQRWDLTKTWTSQEESAFWLFNGLMLLFCILCLVSGLLGSYFGSKSALLTTQAIREGMFAKIQSLSFGDIDKITTSGLITRMTNDVQKFQMALQMILTTLLQVPIMLVAGIVILFLEDPIMGAVSIVLILVLTGSIGINAWKVIPLFDKAQSSIDNSNRIMRENILGMRVVKAFTLEDNQQNRFKQANERLRKYNTKSQVWMSLLIPMISLIMQVTIGIVLLIGGIQMNQASGTPDDIINTIGAEIYGMIQILFLLMSSVIMGLIVIINIFRSKPSISRINAVFSINPSIKNIENPKKIPKNLDIKFENVNFKYNKDAKKNVLENISCEFKQGDFIGIVGGTGSGKSSLVSLIPRLYDCQNGRITIGGVSVKELDINEIRDQIGVVIQENILFSGTIMSNLKFGDQRADKSKLDWACKIACVSDFIKESNKGYETEVEQRGRNFSGGQRQRLTIARALVKNPKILILDDSTSALDLATEAKLQSNLKKELQKTTVIIVAQRISSVKDCNRILVLDKGRIVGAGTHDQLRKNNQIYRSIVISQMGKEGLK